ncbi:MAG: hypothetical protein RIS80_882 [Actinomycetota bacterium]
MTKKPKQQLKTATTLGELERLSRVGSAISDLKRQTWRVLIPAVIYTSIYLGAAGWGIYALITHGMDAFWSTWYFGPLTLVLIWGNALASRKYIKPAEIEKLEKFGDNFESDYFEDAPADADAAGTASAKKSGTQKN